VSVEVTLEGTLAPAVAPVPGVAPPAVPAPAAPAIAAGAGTPRVPPPAPGPSRRKVPRVHSLGVHVRATILFLVLSILLSGFAYPAAMVAVAQVIAPDTANGSLLHYPNGTVAGSALVAQNTSAPYLFWSRPSLTDYNTTLGADTPPGPTDPALASLINETLNYTRQYGGFAVNATLPIWFVAPSASSIDPDLTPEAVLIQIPRVAAASNLSIPVLTYFVNSHIHDSVFPYVGVPYVDVLQLDLDLLPLEGR
jgi:potassium-transporting ATPase KdpC subunit